MIWCMVIHDNEYKTKVNTGLCQGQNRTTLSISIQRMSLVMVKVQSLKGTTPWFARLEKLSQSFSSSSFVIRVNLLHP